MNKELIIKVQKKKKKLCHGPIEMALKMHCELTESTNTIGKKLNETQYSRSSYAQEIERYLSDPFT